MATKAEQFRSQQERSPTKRRGKGRKPHKAQKKPKKGGWSHEKHHADVKATHAFEATAPGKRPSRKSTRGSANRAKPDAALNINEENRKGAPEQRARRARVKGTTVRGSAGNASARTSGR